MSENKKVEKTHGMKFEESPVSNRLLDDFSKKFGPRIAPIVLLKGCAVASSRLEWPRLSAMHVAPTRQLKSFTSREVMKKFRPATLHRHEE